MKTKLNVKTLVAAAAGLAGLVVYGVTSATGYLAGSATNPLPIVCTIAALLCLAARMFAGEKLPGVVNDLLLVLAALGLIASFTVFTLALVPLAADVYFIPVNYPAAEETALHTSIVGVAAYLVAIVALIVDAFTARD